MGEDLVQSIDALAAALGRKPRSIHYLLNQGLRDACRQPDGSYSLSLAQQWLSEHKPSGKQDPLAGLKKRELRAKIAGRVEDLQLKRLKREVESGQLIYRDEVLAEFSELLAHAKPLLDELPDTITKEVPLDVRVQVLQLVTNSVERFFHQLCAWEPKGGSELSEAGPAQGV